MTTFNEFNLNESLLKGIEKLGFTTPTDVQSGVIPLMLHHPGDVVALAPTGTGKTAAFGLPLLQRLDLSLRETQALVVTPTRELCNQVTSDLSRYAAFLGGVEILAVYGGAAIRTQVQGLKRRPHVIVATPGRLLDHLRRGSLTLETVKSLVLDEADEMLSLGFREDMEHILKATGDERRVCLFSATMPQDIRRIVNAHLKNISEVKCGAGETADKPCIEHRYVLVQHRDRERALEGLVAVEKDIYGIVFCRTKEQTKEVANAMAEHGFAADALHGDLSQIQREYVMNRFRNRYIRVLVATDVAARGIDVEDLTHVIHYELPDEQERYIHRSGRTGRAGKRGISIAIVSPRELGQLRRLEKLVRQTITKIEVPRAEDILRSRLARFVDDIENGLSLPAQYEDYALTLVERLSGMRRDDLVRNFLAIYLKTLAGGAGNDENINVDLSAAVRREDSGRPSRGGGPYRGKRPYAGRGHDFRGSRGPKKRKY